MLKLYDCHMHTAFSGDCEYEARHMIAAAKAYGLNGVAITDHLDFDFPEGECDFNLDFKTYSKALGELSEVYSTKDFDVIKGIEMGLQECCVEKNLSVLKEYEFDYVIGSVHVVDGMDPYEDAFWENRDEAEAVRRYYEAVLKNIKLFDGFDSLGHVDYIFRYAKKLPKEDTYKGYEGLLDEILLYLIKHDKALELNTGAIAKGLANPNPGPDILKRYKSLGGKLITIGADAHSPVNVGIGFDRVEEWLKESGFSSYFVYKNRQPIEIGC